jgi:Methane oxygenase PmoA
VSTPHGPAVVAPVEALELRVHGHEVAHYVTSPDLADELSPRPYLHPVRTLSGVVVTDARPDDHQWHLGVSVAVQDVAGSNFWGGPTYDRDHGYQWRDDHGRVLHDGWLDCTERRVRQNLRWVGRGGDVLLHESRCIEALLPQSHPGCWLLAVQFTLSNPRPTAVSLGSPGTHGRRDAGYGGFFWRLPPSVPAMTVRSPGGSDERSVHGRAAAWMSATGHAGDGRAWSVLLVPGDDATANDPWFVRVADYPAIGSALAFDEEVVLEPSASTSRTLLAVVADGTLSTADCVALHSEVPTLWAGRASA